MKMGIGYAILGFVIGVFVSGSGGSDLLGPITGAVIGFVLAKIIHLEGRIKALEWSVRRPGIEETSEADTSVSVKSSPESQKWAAVDTPRPWSDLEPEQTLSKVQSSTENRPESERGPILPSLFERGLKSTLAWFSSGNLPVKIGVIVTFIGVSFLLKYAIDRQLVVFPLEFRLLAVAAVGLALIIIGWRLREKMRVYALSLQGGGIGILFLTIFAALRLWQLLPATLAFVLLVVLTFLTGALAVLQNARSLAIFGIVGGFLAPVLTSTGEGSHVALFSYYLVLNGAILGISWFRAWRELNLVGFVFTFVIASFWGHQYYKPELMASTMPFLVLHFVFYQAIAILYTLRQRPGRIDVVDGALVFGTPVVVFALQAALVRGTEYGLAISAAVVALFYVLTAVWLFRKKSETTRLLTESFIALAVAFATITIPLALDARWTAAAWALEGAALVWIGTRQGRQLPKFTGVLLILFSGLAFLDYGWRSNSGLAVLNGNVLGGLLISLSALFSSRRLQLADHAVFERLQKIATIVLFLWGVFWWFGTGLMEIMDRMRSNDEAYVFMLFVAVSMGFSAWLGQSRDWVLLRRTSLFFLPFLLFSALLQLVFKDHFLREFGYLAWPLAWLAQVFILKVADQHEKRVAGFWHFGSVILLVLMTALEVSWWVNQVVSTSWAQAAAVTMIGVSVLLLWRGRERPAWPVPVHPVIYFNASLVLLAIQVLALMAFSIDKPGSPYPMLYIPLFNPFDLAMLFAMLVAVLSFPVIRQQTGQGVFISSSLNLRPYRWLLGAAFFVLTTIALVRGVFHFTEVAWQSHALFSSLVVQTSLSVYWGLLGFTGMIWGARSGRRSVWVVGAGFMALVIVKLFLVDLGNTGTVERIISFLAIGGLLLVVGYFAPVPPRIIEVDEADNEGEADET
jgi:uncharacterized membrane protein